MPPDRVDVNVHPTKAEVRFLEQSLVHEVLRRALGDALGQGRAPELQFTPFAPRPDEPRAVSIPGVLAGATVGSRWMPRPTGPFAGRSRPAADRPGANAAIVRRDRGQPTKRPPTIRPMIPLGQFRDTFIIAIDDEGVAIIDQHVAHERVLFERVMETLTAGRLESQRLLDAYPDRDVCRRSARRSPSTPRRSNASASRSRSSAATACGSRRFPRSSTRPSAKRRCARSAEDLEGLDRGSGVQDALRRIAATMACHAAVKANYPLTMEKMHFILEELRRTAYSSVCPHGRPVVLRLSRREIEKNFQRI